MSTFPATNGFTRLDVVLLGTISTYVHHILTGMITEGISSFCVSGSSVRSIHFARGKKK